MKNKHYEFKIIDTYNYTEKGVSRENNEFINLDAAFWTLGREGWSIVSTNFVDRGKDKAFMVVVFQREIPDKE